MKILPLRHDIYVHRLNETKTVPKTVSEADNTTSQVMDVYPPMVYFTASAVDVDAEKIRLKRMVDELASPFDKESFLNYYKKVFDLEKPRLGKVIKQYIKDKSLSKEELDKKLDELANKSCDELCQRTIDEMNKKCDNIYSQNIEPALLNQFKAAIDSGNFNLRDVHRDFYKSLYNINSVDELLKQYPYMPIPADPRYNIAARLIATIPVDDILMLADIVKGGDDKKMNETADKIIENLYPLCQKYMTQEQFDNEIYNAATNLLSKGIIEYIKQPFKFRAENPAAFNISNEELGLLKFDYDQYVIQILRAILAQGEDISEISCSVGDFTMFPAKIKNPDYKFRQIIPNQINKILSISDKIKRGERDYDRFGEKQLRSRLEFYENSQIAQNENVLEAMMAFEYAKLLPEDFDILRKVLRGLDEVSDGNKTAEDFVEFVKENDLTPKGKARLDKLEMEQLEKQIREHQKYEQELKTLREQHSEIVLLLHTNKLARAANILSGYYPQTLENPYMNEMISIVKRHVNADGTISHPKVLDDKIFYLDKFNSAKLQDNPFLPDILRYFDNDKLKAGQCLYNLELVRNYPQSVNKYFDENIFDIVVTKINENSQAAADASNNQKTAAVYLTKYSSYNDMDENDKKVLSKFIKEFDEDDEIDRAVMKYLVSEKYVNEDTTIMFKNVDGVVVPAIFASSAKQGILEHYNYPKCIDYMMAFEHAMTKATTNSSGASGIKYIGYSDGKPIGYEVKISKDKDRLYSSVENPYYFGIYDYYGLHD